MEVKFVDLGKQYQTIKPQVNAAIADVLERTDFILGDEVDRFEEEFADYCEAKYAVGLDSGASALELGMRALGIGQGDEVLVPANSFIASATAVSLTGATPVFVDADPVTYTIDAQLLEQRITSRTKAIMPVHLYGQPAEMDTIMAVAKRHNLFVVEDACQAHGARYHGQRVGAIGHIGAFSFYPGKNLGAYGDGGALVTNDSNVADNVRVLRNCGQRVKYTHVIVAGNHRLDTIQAAVLRIKLRYLDEWNALRRHWAKLYSQLLNGAGVTTPVIARDMEHVFHLYVVQVEERDRLQSVLRTNNIATAIHYPIPIHLQPAYADLGYKCGDFPVTEHYAPRLLSLPMFAELKPEQVQFITDCIQEHAASRFAPELHSWAVAA